MTHSLRQAPSLINNNLTCSGTYLAYAQGCDVIVTNFGDNKLIACKLKNDIPGTDRQRAQPKDLATHSLLPRSLPPPVPFSDKAQVFCVKYLDFKDTSVLVVGMTDGFQVWSAEGTRMLFFHPIRPANDSDSCFVRGIDIVKGRDEFLVGDSSGAVHVFLLSSTGRGFSGKNVKSRREHEHAISDITCSADHAVTGDDGGTLCIYSVNDDESPGGHNLLSKTHEIPTAVFPCTSLKLLGNFCVASFTSGHLRYIDLQGGCVKVEIAAHGRTITGLSSSVLDDGTMAVASVSEDSCMSVWRVPKCLSDKAENLYTDRVTDRQITGVCFVKTGHSENKIITANFDADSMSVWDEVPY